MSNYGDLMEIIPPTQFNASLAYISRKPNLMVEKSQLNTLYVYQILFIKRIYTCDATIANSPSKWQTATHSMPMRTTLSHVVLVAYRKP